MGPRPRCLAERGQPGCVSHQGSCAGPPTRGVWSGQGTRGWRERHGPGKAPGAPRKPLEATEGPRDARDRSLAGQRAAARPLERRRAQGGRGLFPSQALSLRLPRSHSQGGSRDTTPSAPELHTLAHDHAPSHTPPHAPPRTPCCHPERWLPPLLAMGWLPHPTAPPHRSVTGPVSPTEGATPPPWGSEPLPRAAVTSPFPGCAVLPRPVHLVPSSPPCGPSLFHQVSPAAGPRPTPNTVSATEPPLPAAVSAEPAPPLCCRPLRPRPRPGHQRASGRTGGS